VVVVPNRLSPEEVLVSDVFRESVSFTAFTSHLSTK
jgi:hypothetical protein